MTRKERFVRAAEKELAAFEPGGGDKYVRWYGGFPDGVPWCAIFVSWCAAQAGLPEDSLPKHASCTWARERFRELGRWHGPDYQPSPGDLVYFDWDGSGDCDHVGIVKSCNGLSFTTIEGNSGGALRQNIYLAGSGVVAGFAEIPEPERAVFDAIEKLYRRGVINSPDYWRENYGGLPFVEELLIKFAERL